MSKEFAGADFAFSLLTQPQMLDSFVRTRNRINSLGNVVVDIASRPIDVYLFYSEDSSTLQSSTRDMTLATYDLCHHLGVKLGFVTERQLLRTPDMLRNAPIVLVPSVVNVNDSTVDIFRQLSQAPNRPLLVRTGNASTWDTFFARDWLDHGRDSSDVAFLSQWPNISIDSADTPTLHALEQLLQPALPAGRVRCVLPGTTQAILGVYCVASPDNTHVMMINLLVQVAEVEVQLPAAGTLRNAWNRNSLTNPISLASLETLVLEVVAS